jgi:hypothetical protein
VLIEKHTRLLQTHPEYSGGEIEIRSSMRDSLGEDDERQEKIHLGLHTSNPLEEDCDITMIPSSMLKTLPCILNTPKH